MTLAGLKISRLYKRMSWFSVSIFSVILFSVLCRLELANSSQPSYNESGVKQSSGSKERAEDAELPGGAQPLKKYSGSRSSALSKQSYSYSSSPRYYYPVSGDIFFLPWLIQVLMRPLFETDPYYDDYYERERPGRKFSARSVPNYPMMAVASSNQIGFSGNYQKLF
jgi:hypothetical protein